MNDSDLRHKILTMLSAGQYLDTEICKFCQPYYAHEVKSMLLRLESAAAIRRSVATGLWALENE